MGSTGPRIFFTIADEGGEMREAFDRVAEALEESGPDDLVLRVEPMEGETHGTIFHPAALEGARWLFAIESASE